MAYNNAARTKGVFDDYNIKDMKDPKEVVELYFSGIEDHDHDPFSIITKEFTSLTTLSISHHGLQSLESLPSLDKLTSLSLPHNKLSGGLEALANICPNLQSLTLSDNEFRDVEAFRPLQKLRKLKLLVIKDNPVCRKPRYKINMKKMLDTIEFLDNQKIRW